MWGSLQFYLKHSWNDLRANRQRTFFALLCIAAGVAAIVSLQTLAGMIQNTLTTNLQESNRGDMQIQVANSDGGEVDKLLQQAVVDGDLLTDDIAFGGGQGTIYYFSESAITKLSDWFAQTYPGSQVTYRQNVANFLAIFTGSGATGVQKVGTDEFVTGAYPVMIESEVYPFYSTVTTQDGKTLNDALNTPSDIVLGVQLAEQLKAQVGDSITIEGVTGEFVVQGIVPTEAEVRNPTQDIFAALNGFYIVDVRSRELFPELTPKADIIYVRLPENVNVSDVETALDENFKIVRSTTTEDLRRIYTALSENIDQLVTVMGLVGLLLGSVGIINTMQVIVRRRVLEIAVLKTIGLQANQITTLFLVEAFIMGVLGSVFGLILGWVLVFAIRGVAETVLGQPLPFVFAPNAVISGLIVGTIVTTIFGFIPTLSAGKVRPATVLRPNDNPVPRSGCLQTIVALAVMMFILGLVAGGIIGNIPQGFAIIIGAFIVAGMLYLLLSLLIWLIGRFFPSFGIVDLKISLREMLVTRNRAAVTLLALVVGVFSLSLITLLADSVSASLGQFFLTDDNIFIQVGGGRDGLQRVESEINALEGEKTYSVNEVYNFDIQQLVKADGTILSRDDMNAILQQSDFFLQSQTSNAPDEELSQDQIRRREALQTRRLREFEQRVGSLNALNATQIGAQATEIMIAGRQLTAEDTGNVIVIRQNDAITDLGIQVGDKLVFQYSFGGFLGLGAQTGEATYEIVGIAPEATTGALSSASNVIPMSAVPQDLLPSQISISAKIQPDQIRVLRSAIADIPQTFLLELSSINRLFTALLGQFTAFPFLVAMLGLVVGGVVIANSVALSTLERRREIAIMKSIGLQRERVLGMLLLENSILGFIGGLLGVGLGLLGLLILLQGAVQNVPFGTAFLLMLLCIAVALIAALTTAWGASGEKPLNVLRYE
jgi:ABC-type antimicrobial peptide transport system permease subunit